MMNGTSTIAWRKYEAAVDRLRNICGCLDSDQRMAETLGKIQIAHQREMSPGVEAVARAIGEMIRADLPNYVAGAIAKAQDDVRAAAEDLRAAIHSDLTTSKFMRN